MKVLLLLLQLRISSAKKNININDDSFIIQVEIIQNNIYLEAKM